MKLKSKLMSLALPLSILPILLMGYLGYVTNLDLQKDVREVSKQLERLGQTAEDSMSEISDSIESETRKDYEFLVRTLGNSLELSYQFLERIVESLANLTLIESYLNTPEASRSLVTVHLTPILDDLIERHSLAEISIVNPHGRERLRFARTIEPRGGDRDFEAETLPNLTTDESSSEWFLERVETPRDRISLCLYFDPNFGTDPPVPVLSMSMALRYKNGRFSKEEGEVVGYLQVTVPVEDFCGSIFQESTDWVRIWALDRKGRLVGGSLDVPIGSKVDEGSYPDSFWFEETVLGGDVRIGVLADRGKAFEGAEYARSLSQSINRNVTNAALLAEGVEQRTAELSRNVAAVALLFLGLTLIFAYWMSIRLSRPIKSLTASAQRIADGDLDAEIHVKSRDEIGDLGKSFSEMRDRIKEQIESLERAQSEALSAARTKGEFLANMSHEIRTPMNGVIGMLHLMNESELDRDQKNLAETALSCANSLLNLLNDILDFSKIDAGKLDLDSVDFKIRDVASEVCALFRHAAQEKGLDYRVEIDASTPARLKGDPGRLRQVLVNLVGNAVKFTNKGSVVLKIEPRGGDLETVLLRIEVSDTGIGMNEATRQKVFDPFCQADSSTTRKYGGTGLGLAITHQLVELMGGEIRVESEVSKGSRFWAEVPFTLSESDEAEIPEDSEAIEQPPSASEGAEDEPKGGVRVLLAEDNSVNRKLITGYLANSEFELNTACDGMAALDLFRTGEFDIVLMDCQMPRLSGYEATIAIRRHEAANGWDRTPIVALTANAMVGDREKCIAAGMDDYLTKPIQKKVLLAALVKWSDPETAFAQQEAFAGP